MTDPATAVEDFETFVRAKSTCPVCESEHREVIDILLRRDARPGDIQSWLFKRKGAEINYNVIAAHQRRGHAAATAA